MCLSDCVIEWVLKAQVLSQAQAAGNTGAQLTGNPYYPLPANLGNLSQEQVCSVLSFFIQILMQLSE